MNNSAPDANVFVEFVQRIMRNVEKRVDERTAELREEIEQLKQRVKQLEDASGS